jgi:4-amino-4-deoxy-L-arabinose transferase-like glycosyltransferase
MSAGPVRLTKTDGGFPSSASALAYLPWLWSRVLFPAADLKPERPKLRDIAWLAIVPAVLLYPCLSFWLFEPDEGRYAQIPREMLERGDWTVPVLEGEPYLDKPPLFYWLVMASYRLFGAHDWSARLVPALAIQVSILLTYVLGCRVLGRTAALWGAGILALAPGFVSIGRLLVIDGVLTLCVLASFAAAAEAIRGNNLRHLWWFLSAVACGLGVLTKGPVALILCAIPLAAHQRLTDSRLISRRAWIVYLAVTILVALPWYILVCLRRPEFAGYFLWRHNIVRFLAPFDHQQPIWFYGPILLLGLLPATVVLPGLMRFLFSTRPSNSDRRSPVLGLLLITGLWPVLFFTLSGSKLPTYILPAFPPLALVLGYYLSLKSWRTGWRVRVSGMGMLLFLGSLHFAAVPFYARFHSPMSEEELVRRYCGDPSVPVVCYPRGCDSVAFYLGRSDFKSYRSKETADMLNYLEQQKRVVVLFTHRHSPDFLRTVLPPQLTLGELVPVSRSWARTFKTEYCYMGIVERNVPNLRLSRISASCTGGHQVSPSD